MRPQLAIGEREKIHENREKVAWLKITLLTTSKNHRQTFAPVPLDRAQALDTTTINSI